MYFPTLPHRSLVESTSAYLCSLTLSALLLRALAGNPVHQIFPPDLSGDFPFMGEKVQAWNERTTLFLPALFLLLLLKPT